MGYIALGDLISKAQVEKCGKREFPVLSMTMHDGIVFQNDRFKKDIASIDRSNYSVVGFNQLVVSFPIDEGVLAVQDITEAGIVSPAYKIWDIDQALLVPKYLEMWLRSPRSIDYYKSKLRGTTARRRSIPEEDFLGMRVNVLPKEEQERIVDLITRVKGVILLREQELVALDDLIKARFVEMFGDPEINPMCWPIKTLDTLLSIEPQNGLYKPQSDYVQDGSGTPILRIDAFYDGRVTSFLGLKRLQCSEAEKSRYLLKENDIVINRVNSLEYLGKCAWITGMVEPTVFESNMMRFHVNESEIDPCFLTRLLCSSFVYNQILNRAKKAVNQASINQSDVQSFRIIVPPINLQTQFATFVAQIDKSKFLMINHQAQTHLIENLR